MNQQEFEPGVPFELDGVQYEEVPAVTCVGCAFFSAGSDRHCTAAHANRPACSCLLRPDRQSVIFVRSAEQRLPPVVAAAQATTEASDGSSADYYKLPPESTQLQDLISFRDMNGQMAEIFRAVYRYGKVAHSAKLRDAKKIKFYIEAEITRLETYG